MERENNDNNELSTFFKSISKVLNKYGLKKLLTKIHEINELGIDNYNHEMMIIVVRQVREHYKISHNKLVSNNGNKQRLTVDSEARKMCYILLKKYVSALSEKSIANYFNRNERVVFRAIDEFRIIQQRVELGKELNLSKGFYEKYIALSEMLDKAKNDLKSKRH